MYFQMIDSARIVQVTDTSAVRRHRGEYDRHEVGQPVTEVLRPALRFMPAVHRVIGYTHGPQPRPFDFIELTGDEVDHRGAPTGRSHTFYLRDGRHICRYSARVHGRAFALWAANARDALAHLDGRLTCDNDGIVRLRGLDVGSIACIG